MSFNLYDLRGADLCEPTEKPYKSRMLSNEIFNRLFQNTRRELAAGLEIPSENQLCSHACQPCDDKAGTDTSFAVGADRDL
jgi:hypothetical protein